VKSPFPPMVIVDGEADLVRALGGAVTAALALVL
jgi:hypothetical protein